MTEKADQFNSMESDTVAVYSQRGKQHKELEDRYRVIESLAIVDLEFMNSSFYGIFDGHGGFRCSEFVQENLHMHLASSPAFKNGNYPQAIREGFLTSDKSFLELAEKKSYKEGSCCIVAIWLRDLNRLYISNLGDSRAVICRKGRAIPLSRDHRPTTESEKKRIIDSGGAIPATGRLFNLLSVSRALGNVDFKKGSISGLLTAEPEITELNLTSDDYFLLMASDGFWDVFSNEEAIVMTVRLFSKYSVYNLGRVTKELVREATVRGSTDDITVLLLLLQKPNPPQ